MGLAIELEGKHTIYRFDREAGIWLEPYTAHNAVQTEGKDLWLNLITAHDTTNYMDNAGTAFEVENSSNVQVFTQTGADSGYPSRTGQTTTWQFSDISTNTYTVDNIKVFQGAIDGTAFSVTTGITSFDAGDDISDVSKPNSENWIYQYELSTSDGGDFTTGEATGAALENVLDMLTNDTGQFLAGPATSGDSDGQLQLRPESGTGTTACSSPTNLVADSGFPTRPTTTSARWEWTVADGSCEDANWDDVETNQTTADTVNYIVSDDADAGLGAKGSGEEWVYTYDITM